jgi:hypothetical protein
VVVLKDFGTFPNTAATDEGRGMAQLIHDMVPKARLGFATANDGEVQFAQYIRSLAGVQSSPFAQPGFAAQIIVDDVQYFDEGMFADTLVAQAVDDVTALGVSYFSSAGNTAPTQGWALQSRRRRDRRHEHQPAGCPPACTPAASTTSAAMAA